jgi:hypothetical protein
MTATIRTSTRDVGVVAPVFLAAAPLLGVAGAGLGWWASETSIDVAVQAGRICNNAFQLPAWVVWAAWGGHFLAVCAVIMALVARSLVRRLARGMLRDTLPAVAVGPIVVLTTYVAVDDGPARVAGFAVAALIVVVTVALHVATRDVPPRVPAPRLFSWVVPIILTVTVLALLLALIGLQTVYMNAPNGLALCAG